MRNGCAQFLINERRIILSDLFFFHVGNIIGLWDHVAEEAMVQALDKSDQRMVCNFGRIQSCQLPATFGK